MKQKGKSGTIGTLSQYLIFAVVPVFEVGVAAAAASSQLALQNLEGGALGVLHAAALDDACLQGRAKHFRSTQRSTKFGRLFRTLLRKRICPRLRELAPDVRGGQGAGRMRRITQPTANCFAELCSLVSMPSQTSLMDSSN